MGYYILLHPLYPLLIIMNKNTITTLPASKTCAKCKDTKDISEFLVIRRRRGKHSTEKYQTTRSYCKKCQSQACRDANNGKTYIHKRRELNKVFLKEYKDKCCCSVCGETANPCLDFHHIDPSNKINKVSQLMNQSLDILKEEISKCIILCSNCHRKEEFKNRSVGNVKKKSYVRDVKLQSKCCKCGEHHFCTLDFHHINPNDKINDITRMCSSKLYTLDDIKYEISKCIIICSNCHRKIHHGLLQ